MRALELAETIGANVLNQTICGGNVEHVYAGDRVSDLLNHASGSTMLVSNLTSGQLIRIAELMEVAGICLVNGYRPCEEDLKVMSEHGVAVLVSPVGLFETCGRLYGCLFDGYRKLTTAKSEALNPKSETNSNEPNTNV